MTPCRCLLWQGGSVDRVSSVLLSALLAKEASSFRSLPRMDPSMSWPAQGLDELIGSQAFVHKLHTGSWNHKALCRVLWFRVPRVFRGLYRDSALPRFEPGGETSGRKK